ncbi:MAG: hypothetical protein GY944_04415 [bacterium]|nr:hypothetical protein [bacterium]
MSDGPALALFDFDKTLVSHDSFRLLAELGAHSSFERRLVFLYAAICKLGWIDNTRYKTLVLERIWRGRSQHERKTLIDVHATAMRGYEIAAAWTRLRNHLAGGDRVAVLSASPAFYLAPYLEQVDPAIEVHGSDIREEGERIEVDNLYREHKAARAREVIARHAPARTFVYTDHRDDLEMMRLADHVVLVRPTDTTRQLVGDEGMSFEVLS